MKQLLNSDDISRIISRIATEIIEKNKGTTDVCLIGIHRGGVYLAQRLAHKIFAIEQIHLPLGELDISMYRDDINLKKSVPIIRQTNIPFDITAKKIILVDDVLFTGRSIRAAMDALMDYGRPACIQLAVLVDRGHRELPIHADYIGKYIPTARCEHIEVTFKEEGTEDMVLVG